MNNELDLENSFFRNTQKARFFTKVNKCKILLNFS